jgi:hypothetical protein
LGGENKRRGQVISSPAQKNVAALLAHCLLRALQRGKRPFQRARISVVTRRGNKVGLRIAKTRRAYRKCQYNKFHSVQLRCRRQTGFTKDFIDS